MRGARTPSWARVSARRAVAAAAIGAGLTLLTLLAPPAPLAAGASIQPLPAGRFCQGPRSDQPASGPVKVLVVVLENESGADVLGSADAPFMNDTLGTQCGTVPPSVMHSTTHGSEANYLALSSGHNAARSAAGGFDAAARFALSDCPPDATSSRCAYGGGHLPAGTPSVFAQAQARFGASTGWKVYAEGMDSRCQPYDGAVYATDQLGRTYRRYVARHNPAVFYAGVACAGQDVPAGAWQSGSGAFARDVSAGTLPRYAFFEPDEVHNGHDPVAVTSGGRTVVVAGGHSRIANIDAFLRSFLAAVTAGPDYLSGRLAVIVTFDEGVRAGPVGDGLRPDGAVGENCALQGISARASSCRIVTWVVGRYVPPATYTRYADHFTVLRTVQTVLGLGPALGHAGDLGVGDFVTGSAGDNPFNLGGH